MNKIIGNFLASQNNGSFPLDCETLDYLQTNRAMAEMLGAIAGDKIILSGCEASGSTRSAGYVFLKTTDYPKGEVLYFEGGAGANLCVSKQSIGVTASATPPSAKSVPMPTEDLTSPPLSVPVSVTPRCKG